MSYIDLPTGCDEEYESRLVPRPTASRGAFETGGQSFVTLGQHFQFSVTVHQLSQQNALRWLSRLQNNTGDGHRWRIDQGNLISGPEGTPRVQGANQQGSGLDVTGITTGLPIPEGAMITHITGGQRYCMQIAEDVVGAGPGVTRLVFNSLLRVIPADGDVVEIATPHIEGEIARFDGFGLRKRRRRVAGGAPMTAERWRGLGGSFVIREQD